MANDWYHGLKGLCILCVVAASLDRPFASRLSLQIQHDISAADAISVCRKVVAADLLHGLVLHQSTVGASNVVKLLSFVIDCDHGPNCVHRWMNFVQVNLDDLVVSSAVSGSIVATMDDREIFRLFLVKEYLI